MISARPAPIPGADHLPPPRMVPPVKAPPARRAPAVGLGLRGHRGWQAAPPQLPPGSSVSALLCPGAPRSPSRWDTALLPSRWMGPRPCGVLPHCHPSASCGVGGAGPGLSLRQPLLPAARLPHGRTGPSCGRPLPAQPVAQQAAGQPALQGSQRAEHCSSSIKVPHKDWWEHHLLPSMVSSE